MKTYLLKGITALGGEVYFTVHATSRNKAMKSIWTGDIRLIRRTVVSCG
jgi:hypothetical protein